MKYRYLEEIWAGIDGLSNYAVSNYGRIINIHTTHEVKQSKDRDGHLRANLYRHGIRYRVYIHKLVAKAFLVGYKEGVTITFINDNKEDCGIRNLSIEGPKKDADKT